MKTPPFLLGAVLLFWGFEAQQLALAAVLAGAVESSRFVKIRWRFGDTDFSRIADVCLLGIIGIFAYRIMTGWYAHASWIVIKWLPVVLSPLLLAQSYSTEAGVNLSVLFLFKKKKGAADSRRRLLVDLSFPYFAICLLAAGTANHRTPLFYIGMCLLLSWIFWFVKPQKYSPGVWIGLLLLAAGLGYGIQLGLSNLQTVITEAGMDWYVKFLQEGRDPYRTFTHMGDIGEIKLSNRIVFRVRPGGWDPGSLLLREASYDTYLSGAANWAASERHFSSIPGNTGKGSWKILKDGRPEKKCTVSFYLKNGKGLLKLPNGTAAISNLSAEAMARNRLGAVKVEGKGLVTYIAHYGSDVPGSALPGKSDLSVPGAEAATIHQIVGDLMLETQAPSEILISISRFLKSGFSYSLEQKIAKGGGTVVENFLTQSRSGHCEFFATAAVLLLRSAGIPARYVTGYAVDTWDKMGGWCMVRARHAHAWALAYVDGRWVDVDATPGVWLENERAQASSWHRLGDLWSWLSFGFSKWRWQQDASSRKKYLIIILLPLVAIMVIRIFSKKRDRQMVTSSDKKKKMSKDESIMSTGFHLIEARLNEMGFYRQEWETFASWIDRIKISPNMTGDIEMLRQLKDIHYRCRFHPDAFTPADEIQMSSLTGKWLETSIRDASNR
jgi:protein-glutamine gamma-glutamyltransferase